MSVPAASKVMARTVDIVKVNENCNPFRDWSKRKIAQERGWHQKQEIVKSCESFPKDRVSPSGF
jgi:hypothetical protein